jgi:hypothetical protein
MCGEIYVNEMYCNPTDESSNGGSGTAAGGGGGGVPSNPVQMSLYYPIRQPVVAVLQQPQVPLVRHHQQLTRL